MALGTIERGTVVPRARTLADLAAALVVPVGDLVTPVRSLESVCFRARAQVPAREQILAVVSRWLEAYAWLEAELNERTPFTFEEASADGAIPVEIARSARQVIGLEEPPGRPLDSPPGSQLLQQRRREHDVAVTSALSLCDMQNHPVTVDVGDLEPQGLAESQPGGVARGEDHAVLGTGHAVEKPNDLLGAQDDRQRVAALRYRKRLDRPVALGRDLIEEAQSRHGSRHRCRRELAVIDQVQLVSPDVLGTEQRREGRTGDEHRGGRP